MKKRMLSMVMALAMVMSLSVTVFAEETQDVDQVSGKAQVPLVGTVQNTAKLISVKVPLEIKFFINTTDGTGTTFVESKGQNSSSVSTAKVMESIASGTGTVTNNSEFNIDLSINSVTDTDGLLDKIDMGVFSTSSNAVTTLSEDDATDSKKLSTSSTDIMLFEKLAAEGTGTLKVAGKAVKGTLTSDGLQYPVHIGEDGTQFTVTTTLKVVASAE